MKKQICLLASAVMAAGMMTGCGSKTAETTAAATEAATTAAETTAAETTVEASKEETTAANTDGGLRTGMAVVTSTGSSKDAGDKDGNAQVDSVAAVVVVDADGKIVNCMIDTAQTKMAFTAEGKVVMADGFKTKKELGDDYGMRPASGIGKEWFEQAAAIEEYVIGKTADEVEGIAVDETTKTTEPDLLAGATIKIGSYVQAITEAARESQVIGTQEGDKLGLGIVTNMEKSKDAADGKEGQCQAYSTYVATTTGADGKITAAVIDASQGTVKFDATGKITSDLKEAVQTKRQLGDAYGMKKASGIGKEWFEQASAMEGFMVGKTADEVAGITVGDDGKTTDADLVSSVTISIDAFQEAALKAAADAK